MLIGAYFVLQLRGKFLRRRLELVQESRKKRSRVAAVIGKRREGFLHVATISMKEEWGFLELTMVVFGCFGCGLDCSLPDIWEIIGRRWWWWRLWWSLELERWGFMWIWGFSLVVDGDVMMIKWKEMIMAMVCFLIITEEMMKETDIRLGFYALNLWLGFHTPKSSKSLFHKTISWTQFLSHKIIIILINESRPIFIGFTTSDFLGLPHVGLNINN